MKEEEEAEEREVRLQPLVEVWFVGFYPPVPGLPADPPLLPRLPLLSRPEAVGSPSTSAQFRRDREAEARRNGSGLSAPAHSSFRLHHHLPFSPNLQIPAELEPGPSFSGEPEHEHARATHRRPRTFPDYRWRVASRADAPQGRPWDQSAAVWRRLYFWKPHSELSDPLEGG